MTDQDFVSIALDLVAEIVTEDGYLLARVYPARLKQGSSLTFRDSGGLEVSFRSFAKVAVAGIDGGASDRT